MELRELSLAVQKGSGKQSKQLVKEALEQGLKPADILRSRYCLRWFRRRACRSISVFFRR